MSLRGLAVRLRDVWVTLIFPIFPAGIVIYFSLSRFPYIWAIVNSAVYHTYMYMCIYGKDMYYPLRGGDNKPT